MAKDIHEDIKIGRGTIVSMMGPVLHWDVKPIRKKLQKLAETPIDAERHLSFRSLDKDMVALGAYMLNLERDLKIAQEAYSRCRQVALRQKVRIYELEVKTNE